MILSKFRHPNVVVLMGWVRTCMHLLCRRRTQEADRIQKTQKGDMAPTDAKGDMAPTDANPAIAPLETKWGAWTKHLGAWIRILDLGQEFWSLD